MDFLKQVVTEKQEIIVLGKQSLKIDLRSVKSEKDKQEQVNNIELAILRILDLSDTPLSSYEILIKMGFKEDEINQALIVKFNEKYLKPIKQTSKIEIYPAFQSKNFYYYQIPGTKYSQSVTAEFQSRVMSLVSESSNKGQARREEIYKKYCEAILAILDLEYRSISDITSMLQNSAHATKATLHQLVTTTGKLTTSHSITIDLVSKSLIILLDQGMVRRENIKGKVHYAKISNTSRLQNLLTGVS